MEGIDAKLGQLFVELQKVEAEVPQAQAEADAAEAKVAQAVRKEEAISGRLEAEQGQLQQLTAAISDARHKLDESQKSVGELVRRAYRGEITSSPMALVLTSTSVSDISKLTAAADAAALFQSRLTSSVENTLAENQSQENRQRALTDSITQLQAQAQAAVDESQAAKLDKNKKLESLRGLLTKNKRLADQLQAQRGAYEQAEQQARQHLNDAQNRIKQIDAEQARRDAEARARARAEKKTYVPDTLPSTGGSVWGKPLAGGLHVVSPWGYRIHPLTGSRRLHAGVDLRSSTGEQQYAVHDGVVVESYYDVGCGNMVTINMGSFGGHRWLTRQCHLSARFVREGQRVSKGQVIGLTGSTGRVTGPHVHFEIWRDGVSVNPMPYLR